MLGQNDGVENEKEIVGAFNDKQLCRLAEYQRRFIKQLYPTASDSDVTHAKKIGGQGFKPDVELELAGKKHFISVKKGGGNSVHQEKTELFILFCIQELGMTDVERDSLLAFLYGDGTLDGDSMPEDRLHDQELLDEYRTEIEIVQNFLNRNKRRLLERFLIYGRRGQESGVKADYLYHGDIEDGVWCPLDYDAIDYLVELPNSKDAPLSIGPLTVQVWNRNLEGKPEMESRRHSIQIKWGACKTYVEEINKRYLERKANEIINNSRTRIIGNNNQGIENQDNLIDLMNGKRVVELTSAVKNIVLGIFPHISNSEIIHAGKVSGSDVKPRIYVAVNGEVRYLTVFMGSGNSVHQEKIDKFLEFCDKELQITEPEKNAFLTIMYGDGTLDGDSESKDRLKSTEEVKRKYSYEVELAQDFFNRNKKELIERFLIYGKGGKEKGIGVDYIYYGTDVAGRIASRETVIEYLTKKEGSDSALLSLGSLTTQPWNRNPEAKPNLEDRRHSLQIKWGGIKQDLANICEAESEKNKGTYDGDWEEYELVGKLNRDKKNTNKLWTTMCGMLGIENLNEVYAVRVSSMVYSKLSGRQVLPKADAYLIKGNLPHELLLDNNFWLDEDAISSYDYRFIPNSGISCKRPTSSSFTYAKLTIASFMTLFGNKALGAGICIFVSEKDLMHNRSILEAWDVSEMELAKEFQSELQATGLDESCYTVDNVEFCKIVKKAANSKATTIIRRDKQISEAIFYGKGLFEEPYTANFIYLGGNVTTTYIPSFSITTGSGRHKGNYTIIIKPSATTNQIIFDEEVYSYEEAKTLICNCIPGMGLDSSDEQFLSEIINQGYKREGELVVKNRSASSEYFVSLFDAEDILNAETYIERFGYAAISDAIKHLEKAGHIIEFEKNQYINIRRIIKLCGNADVLRDYCDVVYKNGEKGTYFTIKSLGPLKISCDATELGFEDLFYESLLKQDKRFAVGMIGGRPVFSNKRREFKFVDWLSELVNSGQRLDINQLIDMMSQDYGINVDRAYILSQIRGTEIYYDDFMECLYKNKDAYYKDI